MNCRVCGQQAWQAEYCLIHSKAHANIMNSYAAWKKGLNISWDDYLKEIKQNPFTGEWAKQVATYLLKIEEIKNDKTS